MIDAHGERTDDEVIGDVTIDREERRAPRSVLGESVIRQRAQQVIDALADYSVKVRAADGVGLEGPGFYALRLVPERGVTVDKVAARDQGEAALGLPADSRSGSTSTAGTTVVEVPKVDSERYDVDAVELWSRVGHWPQDRLWTPIGEDITGSIVGIDFSDSSSPHLLIAGTTGSGKKRGPGRPAPRA